MEDDESSEDQHESIEADEDFDEDEDNEEESENNGCWQACRTCRCRFDRWRRQRHVDGSAAEDVDEAGTSPNGLEILVHIIVIIEQNDKKELPFVLKIRDDESAFLVCEALMKNNCLSKLSLIFFDDVTVHGAQAIIDGLQGSAITCLFLLIEDDDFKNAKWRPIFLQFVESAIPIVQTLVVQMHPGYEQNFEIDGLLHGENNDLKQFGVQIGDSADMLFQGEPARKAEQLAEDYDPSNVQHVQHIREITEGYLLQILFMDVVKEHVDKLILGFGLEDEDAILVAMALTGTTKLKSACIQLGSSLRISAASKLAKGIQRSRIEELDLEGPSRMITSPREVQEIMYREGVMNAPTVCSLSLRTGMHMSTALFACFPKLQIFQLKNVFANVSNLLPALRSATQLSFLYLSPLFDAGQMMQLCELLPHLTFLEKLFITGSLTCEEGDRFMMDQRYTGRDHQPIYSTLASKDIRAEVAERLMIAIANHPNMNSLNLLGSLDIGYLGLEMIGLHLGNTKLKTLTVWGLRDTIFNPDDLNCEEVADADLKRAIDRAGRALVAAAVANVGLREVRASLPETIEKELNFYLKLNNSGRYLLHIDGGVPPGVWCHVLGNCYGEGTMYYFLREQPHLLISAGDLKK